MATERELLKASEDNLAALTKKNKLITESNKVLSSVTKLETQIENSKKEELSVSQSITEELKSTRDGILGGAESMVTGIFGGAVGGLINTLTIGRYKRKLKNDKIDKESRAKEVKTALDEQKLREENLQGMYAQMRKDDELNKLTDEELKVKIEAGESSTRKEAADAEEVRLQNEMNKILEVKVEKAKKNGGETETAEKPADTGGTGFLMSANDKVDASAHPEEAGGKVESTAPILDSSNKLLTSIESHLDFMRGNTESAEDRRERLRKSGGTSAVVGGGAGGAGAAADGKGGLLGSVKDILMKSVGLGTTAGAGTLSQIGKLGSKFKGLSKSIGGKVAGKVVSGALAQVAAIAMVGKDVFDIASAVTDDDVRTGIKGADVGGVIGGVLGGAIGFAIGGPAGAALGASLGNMAGEFIGEAFDSPEIVGAVQKVKDDLIAEQQTLATDIADINAQLEDTNTSEAMKTLLREQLKQSTARQTAVGEELKVFAEGGELDIANKAVIEAGKKGDALAAQKAKLKAQIDAADEKGDHAKVAFLTTLLTQTEEDFDAAEAAYAIKAEELRKVAQKTSGALAESSTSLMDKLATEGGFFGTILSGVGSVSEFFGGGGIGLKGEAGGKYLEEQFKKLDGKIAEQEALIKSGDDFDWSLEPRTAIIGKLTREKARLEKVKEEKGLARGGFIVNKPTYLPKSGIVVGEHGTYSGRGAADGGIADGGPEAVIPLSSSRSGAFIDPMARSIAGAVMNQLQMERGMMSGGEMSNNVITDARSNSTNNNTTVINNPSPIGQTLPDEGRDFVSKVA